MPDNAAPITRFFLAQVYFPDAAKRQSMVLLATRNKDLLFLNGNIGIFRDENGAHIVCINAAFCNNFKVRKACKFLNFNF